MDDDYIVEEFSEDDYESSSSDDEFQTFIKTECGLLEIEDDFEAEVDKVMTAHMKKLSSCENKSSVQSDATGPSEKAGKLSAEEQEKLNDDLLYDPKLDDEDEKWVNDKRRSYIFPCNKTTESKSVEKLQPLPNSDAVLNCPACLSLLCLDCQRHDIYKSQYRAMFVSNCNIISSETLKYPNKKNKRRKNRDDLTSDQEESFNPVRCSVCNTEVAVYDINEIYHFFNVLASY